MRPLEETEAAWVTEYFGDDYLRLYQFPGERTDPEVEFVAGSLAGRMASGGLVLDLACGQGRHALPLAQRGFRVVGLDYQLNLLQKAKARGAGVSFLRGDMRQLPFAETFDAVVNLFTAFGYFSDEENAGILSEVARVLRPGGWFVMDVANRDALIRSAQPRSWKRLPDGSLVVSEWTWDVAAGRYTHWQLLLDEHGRRSFTHSVRVYTCTELTALLRDAGFTVVERHGGFRGEALSLDAPRLILIAQKA
ncbi:MAG: class I SAM-dependent methyltransferase [Armatimonadota bacterium]